MRHNYRFAGGRALRLLGLAVFFLCLAGTTCVEERVVDVVVSTELIAGFEAVGQVNTFDSEENVLIGDQIDLDQILQDNGIESIKEISVQSAFFRVVRQDPAPDRTISGTVAVRRAGEPESALIQYSAVPVNDAALADWTAVPLEAGGVNVLNSVLAQMLGGATSLAMTFRSSGTSTPVGVGSNFRYEVKVRFNVVGLVKVSVVNGV